jgi:MFS family permease
MQLALLVVCQGLAQAGNPIVMATAALVGAMLAPDRAFATVPITAMFVATAATTVPAALLMRHLGRANAFRLGSGLGLVGGLVAAHAIVRGDFVQFCVGTALQGAFMAFAQHYRFAAAETAAADRRARAISYVMLGGIAAAVFGPELAKATRTALEPFLFAGCYLAISALAVAHLAMLQFVRLPRARAAVDTGSGRPLGEIFRQPAAVVALLGATIGYGTMSLVMTATPLAMVACNHAFDDAAFVIEWHMLGMFAPSFVTGHLIQRYGAVPIIGTGALSSLACVAIGLSGISVTHFWAALVLLGIGWNFMLVGGTALLTSTYRPEEQAKVQGVNDFAVFGTVALASLAAGALQQLIGWAAVNLGVIAPLGVVVLACLWLARRPPVAAAA